MYSQDLTNSKFLIQTSPAMLLSFHIVYFFLYIMAFIVMVFNIKSIMYFYHNPEIFNVYESGNHKKESDKLLALNISTCVIFFLLCLPHSLYPPLQHKEFDLIKSSNSEQQAITNATYNLMFNNKQTQLRVKILLENFNDDTKLYQYDGNNHEKNLKWVRVTVYLCIMLTVAQTFFTISSCNYFDVKSGGFSMIINMSQYWRKISLIIQIIFLCIGLIVIMYRIIIGVIIIFINPYTSINSTTMKQIKNGKYKINPIVLRRRVSMDKGILRQSERRKSVDASDFKRRRSSDIGRPFI